MVVQKLNPSLRNTNLMQGILETLKITLGLKNVFILHLFVHFNTLTGSFYRSIPVKMRVYIYIWYIAYENAVF
jgi:hypothetical protein